MDQEELLYQGEPNEDALLADNGDDFNDPDRNMETELEAIKARVKEMEDEAEKIRQIQTEADEKMSTPAGGVAAAPPAPLSIEEKMEADMRSIYVGNVDYGATAEELEQHFHGCGAVNRVTIQCNKFDGHPKGFAYIEFSDKDSVGLAMTLDESLFRGRQLKVMPKRTNKPGLSSSNRFPRGRGRGRRNASRLAASLVAAVMQSTMRPPRRSRGRRFHYSPY